MTAKDHYADAAQSDDKIKMLQVSLKRTVKILDPGHLEKLSKMVDETVNLFILRQLCQDHLSFHEYTFKEIGDKLDLLSLPIFDL